jgi:hypothetical protein
MASRGLFLRGGRHSRTLNGPRTWSIPLAPGLLQAQRRVFGCSQSSRCAAPKVLLERKKAAIAQSVEHVIRNDGVGGSNPSCGTNNLRLTPLFNYIILTSR